jgi:diphthine synthase
MSPYTAFKQILLTESQRHPDPSKAKSKSTTDSDDEDIPEPTPSLLPPSKTLALSLSRIGTPTQRIIAGTLEELASLPEEEFGDPLHSVVIVGKRLHPLELEFAGRWCVGGENGDWWKVGKEVYGVERESL